LIHRIALCRASYDDVFGVWQSCVITVHITLALVLWWRLFLVSQIKASERGCAASIDQQFWVLFLLSVANQCRAIWLFDPVGHRHLLDLPARSVFALCFMLGSMLSLAIGIRLFIAIHARVHRPTRRVLKIYDFLVRGLLFCLSVSSACLPALSARAARCDHR
jgi:hypothetical protein